MKKDTKKITEHDTDHPHFAYRKSKDQQLVRNKTAFMHFSQHIRALWKENNEIIPGSEIMAALAAKWKDASEAEKAKFETIAQEDKLRYNEELKAFEEREGPDQAKYRTKKNHIKKPASAYALFVKDRNEELKTKGIDMAMGDKLRMISAEWKKLNAKVKKQYKQRANKEKEIIYNKLKEEKLEVRESVIIDDELPTKKIKVSENKHKKSHDTKRKPACELNKHGNLEKFTHHPLCNMWNLEKLTSDCPLPLLKEKDFCSRTGVEVNFEEKIEEAAKEDQIDENLEVSNLKIEDLPDDNPCPGLKRRTIHNLVDLEEEIEHIGSYSVCNLLHPSTAKCQSEGTLCFFKSELDTHLRHFLHTPTYSKYYERLRKMLS